MNLDLTPFFVFGIVLVAGVITLALWRKVVARQEDDTLHVLEGSAVIHHQVDVAHKLDAIDKWGKVMTVVAAVYLLVILAIYVYQQWARVDTMGPL